MDKKTNIKDIMHAREKEIETRYGYKPMDRVMVFLHNDKKKELILFGEGVYEGYAIPEAGDKVTAAIFQHGIPKITLDSKQTVWGFECWWSSLPEFEKIQTKYQELGYKLIRRKWKG